MDLQGFGATKEYVRLTNRHFEQVHRFYIALDLETTGLSPIPIGSSKSVQ
ncbi:hypothetical protein [Allobaculum sp. Allo2]|nr:hypothetical protein [Allobaculum sp. Allo2]UNT92265.1 hypothetical protein KWG61_08535 [Allobaculum sp. Allo2]